MAKCCGNTVCEECYTRWNNLGNTACISCNTQKMMEFACRFKPADISFKLKEVWFKPEDIKFFIETNNGLLERIRFDHGEVGAQ